MYWIGGVLGSATIRKIIGHQRVAQRARTRRARAVGAGRARQGRAGSPHGTAPRILILKPIGEQSEFLVPVPRASATVAAGVCEMGFRSLCSVSAFVTDEALTQAAGVIAAAPQPHQESGGACQRLVQRRAPVLRHRGDNHDGMWGAWMLLESSLSRTRTSDKTDLGTSLRLQTSRPRWLGSAHAAACGPS